jgi:hypothetical protein
MTMSNTIASYSLRSLVFLHLVCLIWLLMRHELLNPSLILEINLAFKIGMVLIFAALVVDWSTPKEPRRKFSKLIDSLLGVGWMVAMGGIIVYSLGMGTL